MFEQFQFEYERLDSRQVRITVRFDGKLIHIAQVNPAVEQRLDEFLAALKGKGVDVGDGAAQAATKQRIVEDALATLRREALEEAPCEKDHLADMDDDVVEQAREALKGPILSVLADDAHKLGIAGEEALLTAVYLIGTSRLLAEPMNGCIQSPSATGKSYVMNRIADLFPPEAKVIATRFSGNAIFYVPPGTFQHKFVVVGEQALAPTESDMSVKQILRELMSEGTVSKLVVIRRGDLLETIKFEAEGPIAYIDTTTKTSIFDEDRNRTIVLHTDESAEQSATIINDQAERLIEPTKKPREHRPEVLKHWAIQRLIQPHVVAIPFAKEITSRLSTHDVEVRRAVPLLFGCIQASALLHQYQRDINERGCLLASPADYTVAHTLLAGWLNESLSNGLSPGNRQFLLWLSATFGDQSFGMADCVRAGRNRGHCKHQLGRLTDAGAVKLVTRSHGGREGNTYRLTSTEESAIDLGLMTPTELEAIVSQ